MIDNFIKLIIGDLDEKRKYKQMMKRVDSLPKDYSFAFKKIQKYIYTVGMPSEDMKGFNYLNMFTDLVDLFETSSMDGRQITDVIGNDVSNFCYDFINAYTTDTETLKEKLNKEILERINNNGDNND